MALSARLRGLCWLDFLSLTYRQRRVTLGIEGIRADARIGGPPRKGQRCANAQSSVRGRGGNSPSEAGVTDPILSIRIQVA